MSYIIDSLFLASKYLKLAMRLITKKELIKLATKQSRLTKEFRVKIEKCFARYQLKIISEIELFQILKI
jgi:hypothetical protein